MTVQDFNRLLESRICKLRDTLVTKAAEYASDGERLHNFKADVGGLNTVETPAQVLWGYLRKHLQSVYDMIDKQADGYRLDPAVVDEKIGDAVVYLILLEALFKERV